MHDVLSIFPSSPRLGERRPGGEGACFDTARVTDSCFALICPECATTTMIAFRDQPKRSACPCFSHGELLRPLVHMFGEAKMGFPVGFGHSRRQLA